jgi:hypothetical protein
MLKFHRFVRACLLWTCTLGAAFCFYFQFTDRPLDPTLVWFNMAIALAGASLALAGDPKED